MDLGQRQGKVSLSNQKVRACCWAGKGPIINSEVNINHETTTMVVWIYDGI